MKRKKTKSTSRKSKTRKVKKKSAASAKSRAKSRTRAAKTSRSKEKRVKKKRAKSESNRRRKPQKRDGVTFSFDLDMSVVPPMFLNDPTNTDLTIYLKGEDRKITISLVGATFRAHKPIEIVPFDGGPWYNVPSSCPSPHDTLTFHVKTRTKGQNPGNLPDKYTLYFGDGSALDPDIQNPGGSPHSRY